MIISTLGGEVKVSTDYDPFFCPVVTNVNMGPIFLKTHIFWTPWR